MFEERRPFFLEGAGIYQFRTACGDIDTECTGLFYSRRIGRSPQLGDRYRDPANTTAPCILGAAKLSGRLASGTSVGILSTVTSNTVVRWEFRPASTLFFVWQQGRSGNNPTLPNFDSTVM